MTGYNHGGAAPAEAANPTDPLAALAAEPVAVARLSGVESRLSIVALMLAHAENGEECRVVILPARELAVLHLYPYPAASGSSGAQ